MMNNNEEILVTVKEEPRKLLMTITYEHIREQKSPGWLFQEAMKLIREDDPTIQCDQIEMESDDFMKVNRLYRKERTVLVKSNLVSVVQT